MLPQGFQTANIFSGQDMLIVLLLAVFLFGGKKIPDIMKGMGEGIKNFKDAIKPEEAAPPPPAVKTEDARKEEEIRK